MTESLRARLLGLVLRLTEKRRLARVRDPLRLRRGFAWKARLLFPPPWGTRIASATLDGRRALWLRGPGVVAPMADPSRIDDPSKPVILYFHGGGYVFGAPETHRGLLARLSDATGFPGCLPDYRLAPEHPFPAAIEDALAAWRALADRPGGVILGGDSAGGGLALAALAEGLRQGLAPPRAAFGLSPLTDLTFSGMSLRDNARADAMLPADRANEITSMYLAGADPRDPRASPLFADFTGAPPVWLTAGRTEILLDDTRRMAARLRAQGIAVTAGIAGDLPHVWPFFPPWMLPESGQTLAVLAAWLKSPAASSGGS
mgnify:CR=1 FL=1